MAPEVMEQHLGYDFNADIWSFGITALELAHGHAPFSKYPPMKNAPPGLDYKRNKKFSKSFKEMVSMCLVKDPKKRISAEKALKHHFFKHACSHDFVARTVLDGLPPLGDRFRTLKLKELDRLAQEKKSYGEKEDRSQSQYIQGISAWNFDLEDLKSQSALIPDDGKIHPTEEQNANLKPGETSEELIVVPSYSESPVMVHPVRMKNIEEAGDHVMQVQPGTVPCPLPLKSVNAFKRCFDVYEDDINADRPTWKECIKSEHSRLEAMQTRQKDVMENIRDERHDLEKQHKTMEDIQYASVSGCKAFSGPSVPEHVLPSYRGAPGDGDRHKHHQRQPRLNTYKLEDKSKGIAVQQKGRFKVISEDVDLEEALSQSTSMHQSSSAPLCNTASISISAILPPLQSILHNNLIQADQIANLMKHVNQEKARAAHHLSNLGSKSPSFHVGENFKAEAYSNRERELLQQVAELQPRVANLVEELQTLKMRNAQLERKLNAFCNRREEERIERGEAAYDLG